MPTGTRQSRMALQRCRVDACLARTALVCTVALGGCGREQPLPAPARPAPASPATEQPVPAALPPTMPSAEVLQDVLTSAVQSSGGAFAFRVADAAHGHVALEIVDAPVDLLENLWQTKQDALSAKAAEAADLRTCLRGVVAALQSQPGVARVSVRPVRTETVARKYVRLARVEVDHRRFDQATKLLDRADQIDPAVRKTPPRWGPAVRHMSATRARLQALAMGMLNYHDDYSRYPSGVVSGRNRIGQATWLAALLPYVGAEDTYNRYNFSRDYAHRSNTTATSRVVEAFLMPGHPVRRQRDGTAVTHFAGVYLEDTDERNRTFVRSVLGRNTRVRIRHIRDGTANTLLAGQIDRMLPGWAEGDRTLRPIDKGINADPGRGFESRVPGGALFLFVDGHVRFLSDDIDPSVLRALATHNGNETIDEDQY